MNEWTRLAIIAVELIMVTIVISFVIYLSSVGQRAGEAEQARVDSVEELKEYRKYNLYDNQNTVYFPDIAELLLNNKNTISVYITRGDNLPIEYTPLTPATEYNLDVIYSKLYENDVKYYEATLIRHPQDRGLIIGYEFIAKK